MLGKVSLKMVMHYFRERKNMNIPEDIIKRAKLDYMSELKSNW